MFPTKLINVLLIEDEVFDEMRIRNTLNPVKKHIVIKDVVSSGRKALELLQAQKDRYDVIIMDFQIDGGLHGEPLIKRIKDIDSTLQIMVLTKRTVNITEFDFANQLIKAGAMWYCTKYPNDIEDYIYQPTDFVLCIYNAYEQRILNKDNLRSNQQLAQRTDLIMAEKRIIGQSEAIQNIRNQIQQCAQSETTVLIRGASGTGKELVAANIHYQSKRRFEKFVTINCGSLPHDLIESELFGFEKGAFTGAQDKKLGLFEIANNGTIFLDEIAELPLSSQVKLLRVIQEGEIDKIGRTEKIKVNVRIISATNQNLEESVKDKSFREDLYYRINVVSMWMEPLANLRDDIPEFVEHLLKMFSKKMDCKIPEVSESAMQSLASYGWPGNVRELQNVIQRLLFIGKNVLTEQDIKSALGLELPGNNNDVVLDGSLANPQEILPLRDIEKKFREKYFRFVRQHTDSDAEAARKLGLAPPNYHRMCKELGLK